MPAYSGPQADLLQAFLQTDYRILLRSGALDVTVCERHPRLDEIIMERDWAIVTAFNPGARIDAADINEQRHRQLLAAVADAGLDALPARNHDPHGQWPDEQSLLVIGAEPDWLIALAQHLGQLALVAGRPGGEAELWLLGGEWPDPLPDHVRRVNP